MSRVPLIWCGVALACIASFASGVRFGAELGISEFALMDSSAKASVLAGELQSIRAGKAVALIETKEIELDGAIVQAMTFQEMGKPWLFWPHSDAWNHEKSLQRVAQYRLQYPAVVPGIAPPVGTADPADLRGFGEDVAKSTQWLIRNYAK